MSDESQYIEEELYEFFSVAKIQGKNVIPMDLMANLRQFDKELVITIIEKLIAKEFITDRGAVLTHGRFFRKWKDNIADRIFLNGDDSSINISDKEAVAILTILKEFSSRQPRDGIFEEVGAIINSNKDPANQIHDLVKIGFKLI